MPYADHTLVQMRGTTHQYDGQDEIWESNFRVTLDSGTSPGEYLDIVGAPGSTPQDGGFLPIWWQAPSGNTRSDSFLDQVKVWSVSGGVATPVGQHVYQPALQGHADPTMPSVTTVCYSFDTATPKLRGGRGRTFVPVTYQWAGCTLETSEMTKALADAKALYYAVQGGSTSPVATLVVASKTHGTLKPVVQVSVGSLVDLQRRRKNALTETRVSTIP